MRYSEQLLAIVEDACWRVIRECPETNSPEQDIKALNDVLKAALDKVQEAAQSLAQQEAQGDGWQPLTSDTVLPESGYLVLYASHTEDCHAWKLPLLGCSVADFSPVYTHYRVVRGPEAT